MSTMIEQDDTPTTITQADGVKRKAKGSERAAYRAHRRMKMLAPMLTEYAQELTQKDVKVEPGRQTETDGKTIWIEPPFELATPIIHSNCDGGRCPGCKKMTAVMGRLHHEIAHIMHGSFDKYTFDYSMYQNVLNRLNGHTHLEPAAHPSCDVTYNKETVMHIAAGVYVPMSLYLMALEDCRVNEASFKLYPSLRENNKADVTKVLTSGIKHPDGTVSMWSDRDRDSQMTILSLADLTGIDCDGLLDEKVIEDYKELGIREIIEPAVHARDSKQVMMIAATAVGKMATRDYFRATSDEALQLLVALLKALFGHGLEGKPGVGKGGVPLDIEGSKDPRLGKRGEDGEQGDGVRDGNLKGMREEDFDEVDFAEAYGKVIEGRKGLDGAPLGITGVSLFGPGEGEAWGAPANFHAADVSARNKAVNKARLIFEENSRVEYHRNQRRGKLNGRALGKRAWSGDDRLFAKRIVPDTRTYEVLIGMDISGSTRSGALTVIRDTVNAMADVCHRAGINFEIMAHTGERVNGDLRATVYQVKDLKQPWGTETKTNLAKIKAGGGNFDGHTMQFYRKRLDASQCTDKIMFYFTDGAMPAANGVNEKPILIRELELAKRRGYHIVGVGVGTDSPKAFGMDTVVVNGPNDISQVLDRLATKFKRQ